MAPPPEPHKLLTIGGSDSGGAAGIQADLRTFAALGAYGMSVLTVVTAQDSVGVRRVHELPVDMVLAQLDAVLDDYGADAVKTGFLGAAARVEAIAAALNRRPPRPLVVDPVLVDHRGAAMFPPDVTVATRRALLPLATLITPNRHEAGLLTGLVVTDLATAREAAARLREQGARAVLIKGIPEGSDVVDLLQAEAAPQTWRARRLATANTHGAGDTYAAACATFLAAGADLATAVARAHAFVQAAIAAGAAWQLGAGHGPVAQWRVTP